MSYIQERQLESRHLTHEFGENTRSRPDCTDYRDVLGFARHVRDAFG